MGYYADLEFAGYSVLSMKNYIEPHAMALFAENEKVVRQEFLDGEEVDIYEYRSSVRKFNQRLEIMGYTSLAAERGLYRWIENIRQEIDLSEHENHLLNDFNFNMWRNCMELIIKDRLDGWDGIGDPSDLLEVPEQMRPYVALLLNSYTFEVKDQGPEYYSAGNYAFGIYADDIYDTWKAILDTCDPSQPVILNYTELLNYSCEASDNLTRNPSKTIILAEGKTDIEFIQGSLKLLYPELEKFYAFLDFHSSKAAGGASFVVHLLKGFIGCGVDTRVIAVLDNDAAACEALQGMRDVSFPETIRAIKIPYLQIGATYPTLGPQGEISVDINGLACSIELCFGEDILKDDDGNLTPVQWTGYKKNLKKYQGEIMRKVELQENYRRFLEKSSECRATANGHDWSGMESLLQAIFAAFQKPQESLA